MPRYIRQFHHPLRYTAGASSIAAGILHGTIVAVLHSTPFPPLETIFFVGVGIAQIAIGVLFFYRPLLSVYRVGLLINGGMALMFILFRFLPVPFMGVPEGFDLLGITVLVVEIMAITSSLAWLLTHNEHGENTNFVIASSSACGVILVGVFGLYSSSMGMERVFPERSVVHSHGHEEVLHVEGGEHEVGEHEEADEHGEGQEMMGEHFDDGHH